jgi:hypothetical protein
VKLQRIGNLYRQSKTKEKNKYIKQTKERDILKGCTHLILDKTLSLSLSFPAYLTYSYRVTLIPNNNKNERFSSGTEYDDNSLRHIPHAIKGDGKVRLINAEDQNLRDSNQTITTTHTYAELKALLSVARTRFCCQGLLW